MVMGLWGAVSHARRPEKRGVSPPSGDLAAVGQVELGRHAHTAELAGDPRSPRPAVDLRTRAPGRNGLEVARLESPEDAAARIDCVLPKDRALDAPHALGASGPCGFHGDAQVGSQLASCRIKRVSRPAAGDDQAGGGDDGRRPQGSPPCLA
jgi:hypothetical protein